MEEICLSNLERLPEREEMVRTYIFKELEEICKNPIPKCL
jgi:hypothetical protein